MGSNCVQRAVLVALAYALVACATPPPPPPLAAPAVVLKPDRIVLLPQAGGVPSALVVRPAEGGEVVLSQPYATASVTRSRAEASIGNAEDVRARYKALYDAIPLQRRSYLVYFETGGDRLTPDSTLRLNEILSEVARFPAPEVLVVGHTDSLGTDSVNDEISMLRARIVRSRLIDAGIESGRIEAVGRGKRELLVPTRDGVAEPRNRRVEIQVR